LGIQRGDWPEAIREGDKARRGAPQIPHVRSAAVAPFCKGAKAAASDETFFRLMKPCFA
jgi:hypothetical protein